MTNFNSTSINTRTATYFTVDHFKHQIIGTEQNFKKSGILGSDQYNALMEVMAAHANYALTVKVSDKKVEKKQSYCVHSLLSNRKGVQHHETTDQLQPSRRLPEQDVRPAECRVL